MVLALVDDLMFRSKIKSAAARLGIEVSFASSRGAAVAAIGSARPTLLIADLNNRQADPLAVITAIKQDHELAGTRVVGFVSHVDTATIDGARAAGADEVLARSAFAARLPDILLGR